MGEIHSKSLSTFVLSSSWIDIQFQNWMNDPDSVDTDWKYFFWGFTNSQCETDDKYLFQLEIDRITSQFRCKGHQFACTDPLSPCDIATFFFSHEDFSNCFRDTWLSVEIGLQQCRIPKINNIIASLSKTYCRNIGAEFMHILNSAEREWLIEYMEPCENSHLMEPNEKLHLLIWLHRATYFETTLQKYFPAQKRFSLEGGEVLIPALDLVVEICPEFGISDVVIGMAHRGRLNVLTNIFHKPYEDVFSEFNDKSSPGFSGDGDVKYHKGYSTYRLVSEHSVHLTLAANPSHLEAVNSIVVGKSKARQQKKGEIGRSNVLPILIHGDSSFVGQGSVNEVLNLSQLDGYCTGGTIHIILNNQIGFTTTPLDSRSSRYTTDSAKSLSCPIFHVQGESPEDVLYVLKLALEYRQKFNKDVFVEIVCYRRHGHNESDEPAFTQPLMYQQIEGRLPINQIYANTLLEEGFSLEELRSIEYEVKKQFEDSFSKKAIARSVGYSDEWNSINRDYSNAIIDTSISNEKLLLISRQLANLPPGFCSHPKIHTLIQKRFEAVLKGYGIDWGNAEALAYASLLDEGIPVRLSGQDSRRGTFSHRHSVLHDINDGSTYTPLSSFANEKVKFQVWDSPLSEFAVLGFEYGYSLETPYGLTIWEAQFGDFANGAQVIIDQFISSGETKWNRASGLVMYLPHGYEGQGAEHSSARIERYLQMCAGNNMILASPSTPAQFFHLLRRQMKQSFRKPLIIFTPKSLLRHPECVSSCHDICTGSFQEILFDSLPHNEVRSVLLCSGKIYYELIEERARIDANDTAIIRIEQLYPFREDLLMDELSLFPPDTHFVWVQEEPENMGAWWYIRLIFANSGYSVRYVGRVADSCPAVGSHRIHADQQVAIIQSAFQSL